MKYFYYGMRRTKQPKHSELLNYDNKHDVSILTKLEKEERFDVYYDIIKTRKPFTNDELNIYELDYVGFRDYDYRGKNYD